MVIAICANKIVNLASLFLNFNCTALMNSALQLYDRAKVGIFVDVKKLENHRSLTSLEHMFYDCIS